MVIASTTTMTTMTTSTTMTTAPTDSPKTVVTAAAAADVSSSIIASSKDADTSTSTTTTTTTTINNDPQQEVSESESESEKLQNNSNSNSNSNSNDDDEMATTIGTATCGTGTTTATTTTATTTATTTTTTTTTKPTVRFIENNDTTTIENTNTNEKSTRTKIKKVSVTLEDFMALEDPHPYGVLPGGNQFTTNTSTCATSSSTVPYFAESTWQDILSFCDATTLANMVQVSKYFYVAGHQPELWRDLVLRKSVPLTTINNINNNNDSVKITCWKDFYVYLFCCGCDSAESTSSSTTTSNDNTNNNNKNQKYQYQPHVPINFMNHSQSQQQHSQQPIYSDFLYRNHLCRSFAIPSAWLEDDHGGTIVISNTSRIVPTIDYQSLSAEAFFQQFEERNTPVIIRGAASTTRAVQYWQNAEYLLQTLAAGNGKGRNGHNGQGGEGTSGKGKEEGNNTTTSSSSSTSSNETTTSTTTTTTPSKTFRATSGAAPLPANFSLEAYLQYCTNFKYWEESPLYLFDRNVFFTNDDNNNNNDTTAATSNNSTGTTWYQEDFFQEFYKNCPYWNVHDPTYGHDLLQHLGSKQRPDHTWLIMGPKRSGSVFHIDPNATHAWNVCIQGRKRWIFYPPGIPPPGIHPSSDGDEVALPLSVGEWILQFWQDHVEYNQEHKYNNNSHLRPMECTVHPGDAIFVPHGWWHMVINLDGGNDENENMNTTTTTTTTTTGGYNLAMTHNYVSPSNLGNVLKFFKEKQDQISGCRDRIESIKPEVMYEEFVKALQERNETTNAFLQEALLQQGWTCKAFEPMIAADENENEQGKKHKKQSNDKTKKHNKKKNKKRQFMNHHDDDPSSTKDDNNDNDDDNSSNMDEPPTKKINNNNTTNSVMSKAGSGSNTSTPFSFSFL